MDTKTVINQIYDELTKIVLSTRLTSHFDKKTKNEMLNEVVAQLDEHYATFKNKISNSIDNVINKIKEDLYNDGYLKGKRDMHTTDIYWDGVLCGISVSKICPRCKKRIIESVHHIIPRKYGGQSIKENIIPLCNKCHDIVEELTDDFFKNGQYIGSSTLEHYIITGFPKYKK